MTHGPNSKSQQVPQEQNCAFISASHCCKHHPLKNTSVTGLDYAPKPFTVGISAEMTENSLKALCSISAAGTKGALKASLSFSGASKSGNHAKLAFSRILLQRASLILIFST